MTQRRLEIRYPREKKREEKSQSRNYAIQVDVYLTLQIINDSRNIGSVRTKTSIHPLDDCDYFYGGPG